MRVAVTLALVLALLAAADAPVVDAAQSPPSGEASPFVCPVEGRVPGDAPPDYHSAPDARCVAGGMVELYDGAGEPYHRMTRVPAGWYLTAEGYATADRVWRQVVAQRNRARAELAACLSRPAEIPLPGVPVAPPVVASKPSVLPQVLVGAGLVLAAGYGGCRLAGRCRL